MDRTGRTDCSSRITSLAIALTLVAVLCPSIGCQDRGASTEGKSPPALEHVATHPMQAGTHRPELLVHRDMVFLLVVEHLERDGVRVRHMGYTFDPETGQAGSGFVVSYETGEHGQGADHRATMLGDDIAVVYQSNIMDPSREIRGGPMEQYASSQSLLLARFSTYGEELSRATIVDKATDFNEDSFPDFCILPSGDGLLVSTGSGNGVKFRQVDAGASILSTVELPTTTDGIPSPIGNSMLRGTDGGILFFSSTHEPDGGDITLTRLDRELNVREYKKFDAPGRDDAFPTSAVYHEGYYMVGYGSRTSSGPVEQYPYSPRLIVIDADTLEVVSDLEVSRLAGFGHGHPSLAVLSGRLFFAWSTSVGGRTPQVVIEEFDLS